MKDREPRRITRRSLLYNLGRIVSVGTGAYAMYDGAKRTSRGHNEVEAEYPYPTYLEVSDAEATLRVINNETQRLNSAGQAIPEGISQLQQSAEETINMDQRFNQALHANKDYNRGHDEMIAGGAAVLVPIGVPVLVETLVKPFLKEVRKNEIVNESSS